MREGNLLTGWDWADTDLEAFAAAFHTASGPLG